MDYEERRAQASAYHQQGLARVRDLPAPDGQKFPVGARVRIADELCPEMSHFPKGRFATVNHTYAHAFGGDNVKSYSLNIDDIGTVAWYREDQLTLVPDEIVEDVECSRLTHALSDDAPQM